MIRGLDVVSANRVVFKEREIYAEKRVAGSADRRADWFGKGLWNES